jgi:hypothetical protein
MRRGKQRAMMAVADSILGMASDRLQRREPDRDAGADFCAHLQPDHTARRRLNRLERLGDRVTLHSASSDVMPSSRRLFSRQDQKCR